jgi:hypothetical protein
MANDLLPASEGRDQWDRVASELRACRESQRRAYGDIDSSTLGRYLAGESAAEERAEVEAAIEQHPDLRLLTDLVKDVLGSLEPIAEAPLHQTTPRILSFPAPAARKAPRAFWRKRGPILAAAALLLAVGLGLPSLGGLPASPSGRDSLAMAEGRGVASRGGVGGLALGDGPGGGSGLPLAAPDLPDLDLPAAEVGPPNVLQVAAAKSNLPAPREARLFYHAGERARAQGDYAGAGAYLHKAVKSCEANQLPPQHPDFANALISRADLLEAAINTPDAADRKDIQLGELRKRISEGSPDLVPDVVPTLAGALRFSQDPFRRQKYAEALGKLGPASALALSSLVSRLYRSDIPEERQAVLEAILAIGPAARPVVPALQRLAGDLPPRPPLGHSKGSEKGLVAKGSEAPSFTPPPGVYSSRKPPIVRPLSDREKAQARQIVAALEGPGGMVGVKDLAGCCSVKAAREATDSLKALASHGVEVQVEVLPPGPRFPTSDPEWRLGRMGERAVIVILDPAEKTVRLHVSPLLKKEKFPTEDLARAINKALAEHGCDAALSTTQDKISANRR